MSKFKDFLRDNSHNLTSKVGAPLAYFILAGLFIGLLTDTVTRVVDMWSGQDAVAAIRISIVGSLISMLVLWAVDLPKRIAKWLAHRETIIDVNKVVPPHKGLIALVSRGKNISAEDAMEFHLNKKTLKHCWLIAGPGEGESSSRDNAEKLKDAYQTHKDLQVEIKDVRDMDAPMEVFNLVNLIYQEALQVHHLSHQDLIVDFTGGTKCMTAGAVLACAELDLDLEEMKPHAVDSKGTADREKGSTPILIDIEFTKPLQ